MEKKLPEGVPGPTSIGSTKPVANGQDEPSSSASFQSYMEAPQNKQAGPDATSSKGPFELAGTGKPLPGPTTETILGQMNSTSGVLGDIQNQLQTKNLKLKPSQKYLLRSKLGESDSLIRAAAAKSGVTVGPPPQMLSRQNPVARFLSLITDGQTQLMAAQAQIQKMGKDGKLTPGDLLLIQIKLAKAQQELEYSSVLLSKAVDDTKTLFNIQI